MSEQTLDQFTAGGQKPGIFSLIFARDPDTTVPLGRAFLLHELMETIQGGLTVKSMAENDPVALTPAKGDAYVVMPTGSGAWAGQNNAITIYDGSDWVFATPAEGYRVYDQNTDADYKYTGSAWTKRVATEISYDNATSNLTATDVQAALDEVVDQPQKLDLHLSSFGSGTAVTTGNGTVGIPIPATMNGMDVIAVLCAVHDKGVTGTTDVMIRRRRAGADVDVLSTAVTIGDEFFAADGVIDTGNDDLATGDVLYVDVDAIHSGTAPNGLTVAITAKLP